MCPFWRFAHNHSGSETGSGSLFPVQAGERDVKVPHLPSGSGHGGLSFSVSQGFGGPFGQRSLEAQPVLCGTKSRAEPVSLSAPGPRREVRDEGGASASATALPPATARPRSAPDLDHGRAPARVSDPRTCTRPGNVETWHRGKRQTPGSRLDSKINKSR
ncbi:unnamed protein product [Rangifer tarandus platyrhynchus]|uniref:Uncharacterized protein n=1 Tax=Rangifer tarandus platyrhynchus TaxID=3082113 RepID=A0ABN8YYS0_RANTA|nr:unnamed protein product [Rangifer tarandus platyrhynchus]